MTEQPRAALARTRIALADDDVLLREGLASLLRRSGFEIVDEAVDATGLLALVREHEPDLAIVGMTSAAERIEAAKAIRREFPEVGILLLSASGEFDEAAELLRTGDRIGYLLKDRLEATDLIAQIRKIAQGGSVVDPGIVHGLFTARRREDQLDHLSRREREVLIQMAQGRSNLGVGRRLWISTATVEKHVRSIFMRMRLPDTDDDHRRVLAVLAFLEAAGPHPPVAPASVTGAVALLTDPPVGAV